MDNIFVYWLILLPFIVWGGHFEGPKVFYFLVGSVVVVFFWIIRLLKYKKDFNFSKADYFFLCWLLILLVSSLFGVHPLESILGGSYRHQGVIFFLALWLVGKTVEILSIKAKKLLIKGIAASVLIESIFVISQFLFGNLYFGKALGTLGEASAVAGFLAVGSYFVISAFPKIFLFLPAVSIVLELSRSGLISFIPNLLTLVGKTSRTFTKPIIFLIFGASIVLVLLFSTTKNVSRFESRPLFWKIATESTTQRPLLGFGAESDEIVYNQAFIKAGTPLNNLIVDRAHNLFLDIGLWSGIIGLIVFCWWLYLIFKNIKDINKKYALVSFLLYSMFQPLSIVHWVLMILVINI